MLGREDRDKGGENGDKDNGWLEKRKSSAMCAQSEQSRHRAGRGGRGAAGALAHLLWGLGALGSTSSMVLGVVDRSPKKEPLPAAGRRVGAHVCLDLIQRTTTRKRIRFLSSSQAVPSDEFLLSEVIRTTRKSNGETPADGMADSLRKKRGLGAWGLGFRYEVPSFTQPPEESSPSAHANAAEFSRTNATHPLARCLLPKSVLGCT